MIIFLVMCQSGSDNIAASGWRAIVNIKGGGAPTTFKRTGSAGALLHGHTGYDQIPTNAFIGKQ